MSDGRYFEGGFGRSLSLEAIGRELSVRDGELRGRTDGGFCRGDERNDRKETQRRHAWRSLSGSRILESSFYREAFNPQSQDV